MFLWRWEWLENLNLNWLFIEVQKLQFSWCQTGIWIVGISDIPRKHQRFAFPRFLRMSTGVIEFGSPCHQISSHKTVCFECHAIKLTRPGPCRAPRRFQDKCSYSSRQSLSNNYPCNATLWAKITLMILLLPLESGWGRWKSSNRRPEMAILCDSVVHWSRGEHNCVF